MLGFSSFFSREDERRSEGMAGSEGAKAPSSSFGGSSVRSTLVGLR